MTNTTNYNLLLAEGTDLVNYLTQTNPNFSSLDTIIKGVSDATITTATEVTVGTAHAISRTLPDANVIRFVATSNWVTGDTMTVDGVTVSALKTDGTTLKTGDYIIGATVIGVLDSTRFTVFVSSAAPTAAADITYDNTASGLSATDTQGAIDEICSDLTPSAINISSAYGTISSIHAYKIGKIAIVGFTLALTSAITSNWTVYATVDTPPLSSVMNLGMPGENFQLSNTGNIARYATANIGETFYFYFVYATN